MDDTNLPDVPIQVPPEPPLTPTPPPKELPFRRPADYYDSPPEAPKLRSSWAIGCGAAGCLLIVILFIAGSFFAAGGANRLVAWFFEKTARDLNTIVASDVTPQHREALKVELERYASNAEHKMIQPQDVQPVLFAMQDAMSDAKLTDAEVQSLTKTVRAANESAEKQKAAKAVSRP